MHSILGRESFCRNDCFNAVWHGGNQHVALLRCYGGPGCFDSGLKLIQSVGSCVSQLSLHNIPQILYGVQVLPMIAVLSYETGWEFLKASGSFEVFRVN